MYLARSWARAGVAATETQITDRRRRMFFFMDVAKVREWDSHAKPLWWVTGQVFAREKRPRPTQTLSTCRAGHKLRGQVYFSIHPCDSWSVEDIAMPLPQLVGLECASCQSPIPSVVDGTFCEHCGNPVHYLCQSF